MGSLRMRAIVFDDDEQVRAMLCQALDWRGYEVISFPHPGVCPLHTTPSCECPSDVVCADIIMSDLDMPNVKGIDFVDNQRKKGCKIQHIALMSGGWTDAEMLRAQEIGCKVFAKPFSIQQIYEWLDALEKGVDPRRKLTNWF